MHKIAFLGMGAMGARMAKKLSDVGHSVTVWNRSSEPTKVLEQTSVVIASRLRDATENAAFIFSMVRDDEASQAIWLDEQNGVLSTMSKDTIAIECSTLSIPFVQTLSAQFKQADRKLLTAPVAGSRPQAEAGQLIFMIGGDINIVDHASPVIEPMAAAIHHVGDQVAGAATKLMVNALFGTQLGVMAELIGFAKHAGINIEKALQAISATPVCSPAAKAAADAMVAEAWSPAFPIELVAKDFHLLNHSSTAVSAHTPINSATGNVYVEGVKQGYGHDNITGIVQLYTELSRQNK